MWSCLSYSTVTSQLSTNRGLRLPVLKEKGRTAKEKPDPLFQTEATSLRSDGWNWSAVFFHTTHRTVSLENYNSFVDCYFTFLFIHILLHHSVLMMYNKKKCKFLLLIGSIRVQNMNSFPYFFSEKQGTEVLRLKFLFAMQPCPLF